MEKIYNTDPWLLPYQVAIDNRHAGILERRRHLCGNRRVCDSANNHLYYGLHDEGGEWLFREWAPNASRIWLIGEFNNWQRSEAYLLKPVGGGNWEIRLPAMFLHHGELYKLFIEWPGGGGERIPAYATRVVQDPFTKIFSAQVWHPEPYEWQNDSPLRHFGNGDSAGSSTCESGCNGVNQWMPLIYECHIGMSSEKEEVSTFNEFRTNILPRIASLGYNTLQIMALQEHPYYGSFGYQVSSFFALSSRFGTPEEFKALVDAAHGMGVAVVMDLVHSHSVSNEAEGLSRFDGNESLYFYKGVQGYHPAWNSRCFDYGKDEVNYFLLSNCKWWMEEYHIDGFRFDGVTSMLYWDHGLGRDFIGYEPYFSNGVDENAVCYLALANMLVHEINPLAITIAEDMSGMAGLAAPFEAGGLGFDYRMAMGIADYWIKMLKEKRDEQWDVGDIWYNVTNRRRDERTISYTECHDQALVGDKTLAFRMMDSNMYISMTKDSKDLVVERGVALHKMLRLVTAATAGGGYLNFMGNEFGHPEWIDFPREGNGWSYKYARRQWSLVANGLLRYGELEAFDRNMITLIRESELYSSPMDLQQLHADINLQVLVFRRKNFIFIFNFSPAKSYTDFRFCAPDGKWRLEFCSDNLEYGGFGRICEGETHICENGTLSLYIPSRCCLVLSLAE